MRKLNLWLILAAIVLLALSGCGSSQKLAGSSDGDGALDPAIGADKAVSSTFTQFFNDPINASSGANWTVDNQNGAKLWQLSNTCYSSPKAWVMGANYFNNEYDILTSNAFPVPAHREGIKLSFYAKFSTITPGDYCYVQYQPGSSFTWYDLATLEGTNASYPNWNKYTYNMTIGTGNTSQDYRIRFVFTSNGSGTSWGVGIDSVSVYQTNLSAPPYLSATDGTFPYISVGWGHPSDGVTPEGYKVYRSTSYAGTYTQQDVVTYPNNHYYDSSIIPGNTYWYKVKPYHYGYADGPYSPRDSGWGSA